MKFYIFFLNAEYQELILVLGFNSKFLIRSVFNYLVNLPFLPQIFWGKNKFGIAFQIGSTMEYI